MSRVRPAVVSFVAICLAQIASPQQAQTLKPARSLNIEQQMDSLIKELTP